MAERASGSFGSMHQGQVATNIHSVIQTPMSSEYVTVPPVHYVVPNVPFAPPYTIPAFQAMPPVTVPVTSANPGLSQPYGQWYPNQNFVASFPNTPVQHGEVDKSKWVEQQKKLIKERTFLAQQQKLKQFNVSSAKSDVSSKVILENMFGKSNSVKESKESISAPLKKCVSGEQYSSMPSSQIAPCIKHIQPPKDSKSDAGESGRGPFTSAPQKDPKALENMMLECSDLSAPPKAKTFQKPLATQQSSTSKLPAAQVQFVTSQKARDWQNVRLDELGEMFTIKRPRFPPWCCKEKVPHLYHLVEEQATGKGSHDIDTNILYPILVSSHLPRDVLGRIWEMVNQTTPGQLTPEELYAALALIAIAQAGNGLPGADILHMLPQPPVPILQAFLPVPQAPTPLATPENGAPSNGNMFFPAYLCPAGTPPGVIVDVNGKMSIGQSANFNPDAVPLAAQTLCQNASEMSPNSAGTFASDVPQLPLSSGIQESADDEFDDFKSATVLPSNPSVALPPSQGAERGKGGESALVSSPSDDFAIFKRADIPRPSGISKIVDKKTNIGGDLMATEEDKYSIFRMIQPDSEAVGWSIANNNQTSLKEGAVSSESSPNDMAPNDMAPNVTATVKPDSETKFGEKQIISPISFGDGNNGKESNTEDDFGDFLSATEIPMTNVQSETGFVTPTPVQPTFECDFANFDQFQNAAGDVGEEFGNFASFDVNFVTSTDTVTETDASNVIPIIEDFDNLSLNQGCGFEKPEGSTDGTVQGSTKDNLSSAESQSISSLELASYDVTPGHGGDGKSSISRHGSVPSLDLKVAGVEGADVEESFGDMLTPPLLAFGTKFHKQISMSACSSPDVNRMRENSSPLPALSAFGPLMLLADRYSSIRVPSQAEDSDRHISEWMRCLRSCLGIFEAANKIFGQISSSAVCAEVLSTLEGSDYVKNLVEVYKVVTRISSSAQSVGKKTEKLKALLRDIDLSWQNLASYVNSPLLTRPTQSLSSGKVESNVASENAEACGICLLSVEHSTNEANETFKLFYGGRQYHTTCANLWVNCVEPLLPSLPLPQLL